MPARHGGRRHYQQVTGAAGEVYQYPACRAPLDVGLHPRIVRDFSPDGDERIPETLTGQVLPDLAQIARVKPGARSPSGGDHAITGIRAASWARATTSA